MKPAILIACLCAALVGGCGPTSSHPAVPRIPSERVPVPPSSRTTLIWQPGHFDWTGLRYVWIPGRWVERAGHGTLWQDGYWRDSPTGDVWVPGHWM